MKRVYISFIDRDPALDVANELRAAGIDTFLDADRLLTEGEFTRRLQKEILARGCILLVQTQTVLHSPLVQAELEFAYQNDIEIIPLVFQPLNIRETGEFRFLLNMRSIDFRTDDAWHQLEKRLWQPDDADVIAIKNIGNLAPVATLQGHTSWIRRVTFSPDGYLLASCANDNTIAIWDMRDTPQLLCRITAHDKLVWAVEFAPRHALLFSGAADSTVRLWDLNSLPDPYEYSRMTDHRQAVYGLTFSRDGNFMASASHDNFAIVRDIRNVDVTGAARRAVGLQHISYVYSVAFSPNNHYFATGSRDSVIRLWQFDPDKIDDLTRQQPRILRGHATWVNHVAFSPNSLILASAGDDSTIRLWDAQHGDMITVLTGHTDAVTSLAFSMDGSVLASAARDNTVRLWDVNSLRELGVIRGHERGVNSVVFSPDGSQLVTGSGDSTIKIWTVAAQV